MDSECEHARVAVDPCDQTVGVYCMDCHTWLAFCWSGRHIPESLWNRACPNTDPESPAIPCEQSRDDVCAICERAITPTILAPAHD